MIDQSSLAAQPPGRADGYAAPSQPARRTRPVFWTIVFATAASLGLWALLAMLASSLWGALTGA